MDYHKMLPEDMALYYALQFAENLLSMSYPTELKRLNNSTHKEILNVCKFIDETFPKSKDIIDELVKITIPEAQLEYVVLSISFGVNTNEAVSMLRQLLLENKYSFRVQYFLQDVARKLNRNLCYILPNINQINIAYYDRNMIDGYLKGLDGKY